MSKQAKQYNVMVFDGSWRNRTVQSIEELFQVSVVSNKPLEYQNLNQKVTNYCYISPINSKEMRHCFHLLNRYDKIIK